MAADFNPVADKHYIEWTAEDAAYEKRSEFREPRPALRCPDAMCGASDCPRCNPECADGFNHDEDEE